MPLSEQTKTKINTWLNFKCIQAKVDLNDLNKVLNVLWNNFDTAKDNVAMSAELDAADVTATATKNADLKTTLQSAGYTVTDPT